MTVNSPIEKVSAADPVDSQDPETILFTTVCDEVGDIDTPNLMTSLCWAHDTAYGHSLDR
jgi:hypothetical protein